MKTNDLKRLRELIEKEGFEAIFDFDSGEVIVQKKDIWDGVEFVHVNGIVFKVVNQDKYRLHFQNDTWAYKDICTISNEQAYVEQLKKEAFERFGEIKSGDKFKRNWIEERDQWPEIAEIDNTKREFAYNKEFDQLTFRGTCIYEKGKWAERVKERIEVKYHLSASNIDALYFGFKISDLNFDRNKVGKYLAKQLENYLNDKS